MRDPIEHDLLGKLLWEDSFKWYECSISILEEPISIHLSADESGAVEGSLAQAEIVVRKLVSSDASAKAFAVDKLLHLKNDGWLGEDEDGEEEQPLNADQFRSRMCLTAVSFAQDGTSEWFYNDGDLFWGHTIVLTMDQSGQFHGANIAG